MKTKEELNALKEEVEALNKKLAELDEADLAEVVGGTVGDPSGEDIADSEETFTDECCLDRPIGLESKLRKREHYEKPSVHRRKKAEAARKRKY